APLTPALSPVPGARGETMRLGLVFFPRPPLAGGGRGEGGFARPTLVAPPRAFRTRGGRGRSGAEAEGWGAVPVAARIEKLLPGGEGGCVDGRLGDGEGRGAQHPLQQIEIRLAADRLEIGDLAAARLLDLGAIGDPAQRRKTAGRSLAEAVDMQRLAIGLEA